MGVVGEYLAAFDFQLYLQKLCEVAPNVEKQVSFRGREISEFFDGLKNEGLSGKVKINFDSRVASGFEDFRMESGRVVIERDKEAPLEMRLSPEQMKIHAAPDPRDSYGVLLSRRGSKDGFVLNRGRRFALVYPVGSSFNDEGYQNRAVNNIQARNSASGVSKPHSKNSNSRLLYAIARRIKDCVVAPLEEMYSSACFSRRIEIDTKPLIREPGDKKSDNNQVVADFEIISPQLPFLGPSTGFLEKWTRFLLAGKLPYMYYVAASQNSEKDIVHVSVLVDLPE